MKGFGERISEVKVTSATQFVGVVRVSGI